MGAVWPKRRYRSVMVVGLDGCGKTSLIAGLRGVRERSGRAAAAQGLGEACTAPTLGLSLVDYETSDYTGGGGFNRPDCTTWQLWDLSGAAQHRSLWELYAGQVDGVVFVVDLSDGQRVGLAHQELHRLVSCHRIRARGRPMPVAFCLTKRAIAEQNPDADEVLTEDEARRCLEVDALKQRSGSGIAVLQWHFGENLGDALEDIARYYTTQSR